MKSVDKRSWVRMCPNCGATAEVYYKPKKDTWCLKCSSTRLGKAIDNRKDPKDLIRYTRTCIDCGDVRTGMLAKPKEPQRCTSCSRSKVGRSRHSTGGKLKLKYFRICEVCGDIKEVKSQRSALSNRCMKCKEYKKPLYGPKMPRKNTYVKKPKKKKKPAVSAKNIEKIKIINRKHKAYVEEEQAKPAPKQKISDEDMMAKWLSKHKVTKIEPSIYALEC